MQEHDDVGVLLDRTALAKVGESRPFVLAKLDAAIELRECDHRDVQFFGQIFEASRDERDLLFTRGRLLLRFDELQIVDDDDRQPEATLESPRDRSDLRHRTAWLIVDEHRHFAEFRGGFHQRFVFDFVDGAGSQAVSVDLRANAQQAFGQLQLRHFEAEHEARLLGVRDDRFGDVADQPRFFPSRAVPPE